MADPERLAGYDEDGTGRGAELSPLETRPDAPFPRELRILTAAVVGALVVATEYFAQNVLVPITLAAMLSFVLSPRVDVLQRLGLWRAASVALSVLVALGAIGLIATLLGSQAATLAADVPHYVEVVQSKVEKSRHLPPHASCPSRDSLTEASHRPPRSPFRPFRPRGDKSDAATALSRGTPQQPIVVELAAPKASVLAVARAVIGRLLDGSRPPPSG